MKIKYKPKLRLVGIGKYAKTYRIICPTGTIYYVLSYYTGDVVWHGPYSPEYPKLKLRRGIHLF